MSAPHELFAEPAAASLVDQQCAAYEASHAGFPDALPEAAEAVAPNKYTDLLASSATRSALDAAVARW
ncbi:MAG TPA: hypothetical protein VLF59_00160 [Candidatus Saccharimonadales bacterium]|nr:hypothetical protein [Candidatus Saccharimonadales bacterium]